MLAKITLRLFQVKLRLNQQSKNYFKIMHMFRKGKTINQFVIKKYNNKMAQERNNSFIVAWNVVGILHKPKGMARNS